MLQRIAQLLVIIVSSAWLAGYTAIVLPVIIGRMQPGGQNGNFTLWADIGWVFLILNIIGLALIGFQLYQKRRMLGLGVCAVLICASSYFQFRGHQDTYDITAIHEQRQSVHENTKQHQDLDAAFDKAHKASEHHIGSLLMLLIVAIGFVGVQFLKSPGNED